MPTPRTCPKCGLPLPASSADGDCPRCALLGALSLSGESPDAMVTELPGDRIGRYQLVEKIGEGGFGVVYEAEQTEDVRRRVALKIVKLGMDPQQVLARFEVERQALAMMDHPNIAKILDAGMTEGGALASDLRPLTSGLDRPYFVMELVRGIRITEYCDQHNLSTRARLDLFVQVCHAIQHAHQKGVIHRDLKPANILVTTVDGVPMPKVIDFGIAKATQQPLTDQPPRTALHQFIGTAAYMSPEQAALSGHDIDTRSDIYTLGVLLYELLTGQLPFDSNELLNAGLDEMRRKVREEEPPKPSTRLAALAAAKLTTVARERQSEPPKLLHAVRGDLDWIVMKCLEKDRARRYESASGLAQDLARHLNHEPVVARPPGSLYRFGKLVRRNKVGFGFVAAIAIVLVLGIVASTWQAVRATRAEGEQNRLRQLAEVEGNKSRQVAKFLTEMLRGVGPSVAQGRDTQLLREILENTVTRVRKDLQDQPEIEAEVLSVIGEVYLQLGRYQEAEAIRREVLERRRKAFGPEHPKVADALNNVANALFRQSKLPEAEAMHREALAMRRKLLGPDHADIAASLNNLGTVLWSQGKLAEAESVLRDSLTMRRKVFGDQHAEVSESIANLAAVLSLRDKLPEAEAMQREALASDRRLLGENHPDIAYSLNNLADMLCTQGKLTEAESINREALALRRKLLGDEHADVAYSIFGLATTLAAQGKLREAEALHRDALAMRRKLLGDEHLEVAGSLNNLASVLLQERKFAEAETAQREALTLQRKTPGTDPQDMAGSLSNLALALRNLGRFAEAEAACREALVIQKKLQGDEHPAVAAAIQELAQTLYRAGKLADAAPLFTEAARQFRLSADRGDIPSMNRLAWLLATCLTEGVRDGRAAITYAEKAVAATNRKDPALLNTLAAAHAEAGQFEQAIAVHQEAITLLTAEEARQEFASRLKLYESKTSCRDTD